MEGIPRRKFLSSLMSFPVLLTSHKSFSQYNEAYSHLRSWDKTEFRKYSTWIEHIYEMKQNGTSKQKMSRLNSIFGDSEMDLLSNSDFLEYGNPTLSQSERNIINSFTHCGNFPKIMLLYYSYRRGLPASVSKIKMEKGSDIRYSHGNHAVSVVYSMPFNGDFLEFFLQGTTYRGGGYNFVSGNFRTAPFLENTDSVPIKISREFLIPGTMAYNANGHCLLVVKVDDSGEVHFLDSHPDHSITFNQTLSAIPVINSFDGSDTDLKRSFDGFRAMRLSKLENERVRYFTNEEMEEFGFSIEQYEKMDEIREANGILINGVNVHTFPEFVIASLKLSKENPLEFLTKSVRELGDMFREREAFVQEAWQNVLSYGPIVFPNNSSNENIYQATGRWEVWSSPSSDIDRRNKYDYMVKRLEEMVEGFPNDGRFDYNGFKSREELVDAIFELKDRLFSLEVIEYRHSSNKIFLLDLRDVEHRLFDLSFNPNHPPELRWGSPVGSNERENMNLFKIQVRTGEVLDALEIYDLERGLRYYNERQTTPSYLDNSKNPTTPPFRLMNVRLSDLLKGE